MNMLGAALGRLHLSGSKSPFSRFSEEDELTMISRHAAQAEQLRSEIG